MSSTAISRVVLSRVVMTTGDHTKDQVGRNVTKRDPANDCKHRQADASVNSSTEDESRHSGDRQGGEGFVPDVFAEIPVPRRAICWNIHAIPRSKYAPYDPRGDITDGKRGCDGYPRFTANELTKIEVESLFLNVLPRRLIAVLNRLAGGLRGLTTLIHCLAHGRICNIFKCHRYHLIARELY